MSALHLIPLRGFVFLPEIYLAITLIIILFYGIFQKSDEKEDGLIKFLNKFFYIGISLIIFNIFLVFALSSFSLESADGLFNINSLIFTIKTCILGFTILFILVSKDYLLSDFVFGSKYIVIMLFSVLGLSLLVSSNDFISMFLSVEFSSLPFYLLAINKKYSFKHNNAILKYFILSLVSSAIMLYGISFIYGFAGSTNFSEVARFIVANYGSNLILMLSVLLIIIGLSFKISLAPFHMWIIDVYEGLNYALVLLLNTIFKLAFFFILLKILWITFESVNVSWAPIIYILSVCSMIIGYVGAVYQSNIVRIIAYSSVSQMGFVAILLLSKNNSTIGYFLLFFLVYIISNIGIFGILMWSKINYKLLVTLNDLKGFSSKNPFYAFMLSIFFLSLAGLPPLGGFFTKIFIVYGAMINNYYVISVFAVLITIFGMFFYVRIVRYIYIKNENAIEEKIKKTRFMSSSNIVIVVCFLIILLFSVILIPLNSILGNILLLHAV